VILIYFNKINNNSTVATLILIRFSFRQLCNTNPQCVYMTLDDDMKHAKKIKLSDEKEG
jgi:hypothetical protein